MAEAVKEKKKNIFVRVGKKIAGFFKGIFSELKKVSWPTKKQVVNNTIVALVVMIVAAIVIWGFDQIAKLIIEALVTLTRG